MERKGRARNFGRRRKKESAGCVRKKGKREIRNRCKEMRTKREGAEKMLEKAFHEKTG